MRNNEAKSKDKAKFWLVVGLIAFILVGYGCSIYVISANASGGKGLKVYLTVNSNQGGQDSTIRTYQYGDVQDSRLQYINEGSYQYELKYQKQQIDRGEFMICVELINEMQGCANGYNGVEKSPVYVALSIQGEQPEQQSDNGQSQAQSSSNSNENNNNNALSQSQETTIWICKEGGCTAQ